MDTPFESVTRWQDWLTLNAAKTTTAAYTYEVRRLMMFYPDRDPREMDFNELISYLASRKQGGLGEAAIYRATNALKSFYRHACGKRSPAKNLPMKKPALRQQRTLTFDQVDDLLASIDTSTPIGRRNLALVCLAMDTGFRASELCRINDDQVDLRSRLAWVKIKGGKEGFGAFSEDTAQFCAMWRAERERMACCEAFFVGFELHRPGHRLTREGLTDIVHAIGRNAGIKLSPHDLRRTMATQMILLGAPSRLVQVGGRWGDLKQVERYTLPITAAAVAPYSPVTAAVNRRVQH